VDLALGLGEWAGLLVIVGNEGVDVRLELLDGLEGRAIERFSTEDREPELDLVEPARFG